METKKVKDVINHMEERLRHCVSSVAISKVAVESSILALKKQIPQKPIEKHYEEEGEKPYIKYKCPSCQSRYQISKNYDFYCPQCGQKIDWD